MMNRLAIRELYLVPYLELFITLRLRERDRLLNRKKGSGRS